MPIFFNPLSFFRRIPLELLKQFFSQVPAFTGFDWGAVSQRRVEPIDERCSSIPPAESGRIFSVFRMIDSLANSVGTQVLIEAARDLDLDIAAAISGKKNGYERALWCYLLDKRIFQCARTLARIENLPKRSSETLRNLPKKSINVTPEMLAELGSQLREFFWNTQKRGRECRVEHRRREGDVDCFFAYPADFCSEQSGYDDSGRYGLNAWTPEFEVLFRYRRTDGAIDICAQGGRGPRRSLAQIFARVVLGIECVPEALLADGFNLEVFKNPAITFPTNPIDNIISVRVQAIKL